MPEHNQENKMFSQLMAISHDTLESGHYETAYHALVAAMHYARDLNDIQSLAEVAPVAKAHQAWIDAHAPKHRMSTQSTAQRHNTSLFNMLALQAATQEKIVEQVQRREDLKDLPWPGDAKVKRQPESNHDGDG